MKIGFPCYVTSFPCACTVQEVTKRIAETAACKNNNLKILKTFYTDIQKIVLSASTGGYVYYNSFMPVASINLRVSENETLVFISFDLKKSTKVLMIVFYVLVFLFELALLALWVTNQLASIGLLLFPLGLLTCSYVLSVVGLFFSSKGVLRILFDALASDSAQHLPILHKSRFIE